MPKTQRSIRAAAFSLFYGVCLAGPVRFLRPPTHGGIPIREKGAQDAVGKGRFGGGVRFSAPMMRGWKHEIDHLDLHVVGPCPDRRPAAEGMV